MSIPEPASWERNPSSEPAQVHSPNAGKATRTFLGVGLVLSIVAALMLGAFLLLSGFPHGEKRDTTRPRKPPVQTVQEGTPPRTSPDLVSDEATDVRNVTHPPARVSAATEDQTPRHSPPLATPIRPTPKPQPPPARIDIRPSTPRPPLQTRVEPPASSPSANEPGGELTEGASINRLAGFIRSSSYYGNADGCIHIRSLGYKNRGYTLAVDGRGCDGEDAGIDDLWRVDTLTGEVFKQRKGHFRKP